MNHPLRVSHSQCLQKWVWQSQVAAADCRRHMSHTQPAHGCCLSGLKRRRMRAMLLTSNSNLWRRRSNSHARCGWPLNQQCSTQTGPSCSSCQLSGAHLHQIWLASTHTPGMQSHPPQWQALSPDAWMQLSLNGGRSHMV